MGSLPPPLRSLLDSVVSARYLSAAAVAVTLWDHILTFESEWRVIWLSKEERWFTKATYFMERYVTEGVLLYVAYVLSGMATGLDDMECRRFIWVFTIAATIFITVSEFIIIIRLYRTWDQRFTASAFLITGFVISISAACVLAIVTVLEVQPNTHFIPLIATCGFLEIPSTLPWLMASLLAFDVFLLVLAVYNAIKGPHRSNAEIVDALHRDGAKLFIILTALRVLKLLMSIVGNPASAFGVITLVWGLDSVIGSRIHLRVEGLRVWGAKRSFLSM